uniref:Probable sugar phosphate/phosphate translocator At1g06470 isoform X1 n=1 Tax=Nicotiana sylvestris TaxID=4096 RepID=A0A1U7VKF4_NICSY|nr:PREDICTED: probable sugar phosphate/phosphate translocator At1g06470 isoform X1 [Nicotiana sylvestris]
MKGGDDLAVASTGNGKDRYVPFDVENGSRSDPTYSSAGGEGSTYTDPHGPSRAISKNVVSVADVLKTLVLILVWYTFSTFLTLYNKTLLGDHLGKFPAPLLMNTFHFAMQAILSKFITWFCSRKFQPTVMMSWKDYFLRDGLCLSQLYPQLSVRQWMSTSAMHPLFSYQSHLLLCVNLQHRSFSYCSLLLSGTSFNHWSISH